MRNGPHFLKMCLFPMLLPRKSVGLGSRSYKRASVPEGSPTRNSIVRHIYSTSHGIGGTWLSLNLRYNSGQVPGASPCFGLNPGNDRPASTSLNGQPAIAMVANNAPMTADEEFEGGFVCGNIRASITTPLPMCLANGLDRR